MRGRHLALGVFEAGRLGDDRRLHALSPGPKLGGLTLAAVVGSVLWRLVGGAEAALGGAAFLAAAAGLCLWAGFSGRRVLEWSAPAVWIVAALALVRVVGTRPTVEEWLSVAGQGLGVISVMLLARLFVATTRTSDLVDSITEWLQPLRPLGVRPGVFALTVSLMIRSIPLISGAVGDVADAHRARGLRRTVRTVALPSALQTMAATIAVSEALSARMLPADEEEQEISPER